MLANEGVGKRSGMRPFLGLPVSQKNRNVRSSRSAKNGSRATGDDAVRSAPVATGAGVGERAAASGPGGSELPATPVRPDRSAQIAISTGKTWRPRDEVPRVGS